MAQSQEYYAVRLNTKAPNTFSLNNPEEFFSPKSIERKNKFNIPIDSLDLPMSRELIDSLITLTSGNIVTYSNWHNTVVINIAHSDTSFLQGKSFVESWNFIGTVNPFGPFSLESKFNTLSFNEYPSNYNFYKQVEGLYLHGKGFFGEGITIAVFDNGFEGTNTNTYFSNNLLFTKNLVAPNQSYTQGGSHGTEVWSLLCGNHPNMKGTTQGASYILLVTEDTDREHPLEMYHWARAAEIADSLGTDIINSSLGYFDFEEAQFNLPQDPSETQPIISSAVEIAQQKGILVVSSAGNEGNKDWINVIYPGNSPASFTVGACTGMDDRDEFSSIGYPNGQIKPNVLARGRNVRVIKNDGTVAATTGTSYSAPIISGFSACLWQAFPDWNSDTLRARIERSASNYNRPNNKEGYGVPNYKSIYLKYSGEPDSSVMQLGELKVFQMENKILINSQISTTIDQVEIYDLNGKTILSSYSNTSTAEHQFNLPSEIVQGIYLCKITINQSVILRKIYIQ